jgi:hypothetical protein
VGRQGDREVEALSIIPSDSMNNSLHNEEETTYRRAKDKKSSDNHKRST